jgi:hypothetical protein
MSVDNGTSVQLLMISQGTAVVSELNRVSEGKRAFCALRKRDHLFLQPLGDKSLELFGNHGDDLSRLVKRSRDIEVDSRHRNYSRKAQHCENVALGQVSLGADAVEIPLCRGWDVAGPRSLGD